MMSREKMRIDSVRLCARVCLSFTRAAAPPISPPCRAVSMMGGLAGKHGENTHWNGIKQLNAFPNLAEKPLGLCVESPRGLITLISGSERARLLGRSPG